MSVWVWVKIEPGTADFFLSSKPSHFGVPNFGPHRERERERLLGPLPSSQSLNPFLFDTICFQSCCLLSGGPHLVYPTSTHTVHTLTILNQTFDFGGHGCTHPWNFYGRLRGSHHLHCQEMRRATFRSWGVGFLRNLRRGLFLGDPKIIQVIACEWEKQWLWGRHILGKLHFLVKGWVQQLNSDSYDFAHVMVAGQALVKCWSRFS